MPSYKYLILLLLLLGFSYTEQTFAEVQAKPGRPTETVEEAGDPAKNEETITKTYYDNKIVRFLEAVTIKYKDGSRASKLYNQDGSLRQEQETNKDGDIKSTYYRQDGSGKDYESTVSVTLLPGGGFDSLTKTARYREDGKTVRESSTEDSSGMLDQLRFDYKGTLRIKKIWSKDKTTLDITVYDATGKELFSQHWNSYKLNNLHSKALESVTETLPNGLKRRIITRDPGPNESLNATRPIERVEYLKADGSIDRVEKPDALSEPVNSKCLRHPSENF
ncbi:MAG: hypothetical protein K2W82_16150 [Candidatus Obscuribacterales bacterium]|nr:hypothetical protein [Candidatus Obscuribacterales bacterium]